MAKTELLKRYEGTGPNLPLTKTIVNSRHDHLTLPVNPFHASRADNHIKVTIR
jgi:hypothetical protein